MICTLLILAHLEVLPAFQHRERLRNMPMSVGQQVVAMWMEDHEGWVIEGWRCAR